MKKYISSQNGRSMIEMLGVLAIVGVLSVAGIAGYSKAMEKHKLNKAIEQIVALVSGIQRACINQSGYSGVECNGDGDECPYLHSLGIIPSGMISKGSEILHSPWGSDISVWENSKYGADGDYNEDEDKKAFTIYIQFNAQGEVDKYCVPLAMYNWANVPGIIAVGGNPGDEVVKSYVGCDGKSGGDEGTSVGCFGGKTVPLPLPPKEAIAACRAMDLALKVY